MTELWPLDNLNPSLSSQYSSLKYMESVKVDFLYTSETGNEKPIISECLYNVNGRSITELILKEILFSFPIRMIISLWIISSVTENII